MSYNLPIPAPRSLDQVVARVYYDSNKYIDVFWRSATRQVVLHVTNCAAYYDPEQEPQGETWFIQNDGEIMDSLCYFLPHHYYQFLAENIMVFEDQKMEEYGPADSRLLTDIYSCCWSDFACDKMIIHMYIHGDDTIQDENDRLSRFPVSVDEQEEEEEEEVQGSLSSYDITYTIQHEYVD